MLLPFYDRDPIVDHAAEPVDVPFALRRFAMQRRDLLGVLARAHQVETEIGLKTLLLEIERNERPADAMRQHGTNHRIDQRRPYQIAGDEKVGAE